MVVEPLLFKPVVVVKSVTVVLSRSESDLIVGVPGKAVDVKELSPFPFVVASW